MKRTRLTNEIFHLDGSLDSFPWHSILDAVEWKMSEINKPTNTVHHPLNYSLIIDLAAVIEGFLNQVIDGALDFRTTEVFTAEEIQELNVEEATPARDDFIDRLTDDVRNNLNRASWIGYNKVFKLIYDKEIKFAVNQSTWKAISALFTFRHMIVHGKMLTVEYTWTEKENIYEISVLNKYNTVYSYLSEQKLISVGPTGYIELISIKAVQHFYSMMTNFIKEILNGMENKIERNRLLEVFVLDENLNRILIPS